MNDRERLMLAYAIAETHSLLSAMRATLAGQVNVEVLLRLEIDLATYCEFWGSSDDVPITDEVVAEARGYLTEHAAELMAALGDVDG